MRIEICGGIGAGKTTLATLLINKGFNPVIENFNLNPFWESFYLNPGKFIFETEVTFLLQHYHEIKKLEKKHIPHACDFSFSQDLAYAKIGLLGNQLNIFKAVYDQIIGELLQPSLIVCLRCDVEIMLERIHKRGRDEEAKIDKNFLTSLTDAIYMEMEEVKGFTKVIFIDSDKNDYVNNFGIQQQIINEIENSLGSLMN